MAKFINLVKLIGTVQFIDADQGNFILATHFDGRNGPIDHLHTVAASEAMLDDLIVGDRCAVAGRLKTIFNRDEQLAKEIRTVVEAVKITQTDAETDLARAKVVGKLIRPTRDLNGLCLLRMTVGQEANVWVRGIQSFFNQLMRDKPTNGSIVQAVGNLTYEELDTTTLTQIVASNKDNSFMIQKAAVVDEFADMDETGEDIEITPAPNARFNGKQQAAASIPF